MFGQSKKRVYLDWAAASPVSPRAERVFAAALSACGNPSAVHAEARAARAVLDDALALAATLSCVVSVSGVTDLIVGRGKVFRIANGHPMMSRVTGMGCTASALTGAFLAVLPDAVAAAVKAMLAMGVAGEEAGQRSAGPGSFKTHFLDALHDLTDADLMARGRITGEE
mgnify:CR=1 FL=1